MSMIRFKLLDNYTPFEIEFVLFGFSYDKQDKLTNKQKDYLHCAYGNLHCNVRMRTIEVKTFIDKFRNELKDLRKAVID